MNHFDLPSFAATWWPLFMETVPGSGERLTVGVVVRGASGQATVRQAIDPAHLRSMFGSDGTGMQFIVGSTVLKVHEQLQQMVPVEQLQLPFGGMELGQPHDAVARDLEEMVGLALRMSSGFAQSAFGLRLDSGSVSKEVAAAFEEWAESVRLQVLAAEATERFGAAFNVPVELSGRKKARFGFVHGEYVAQFGVLRPGRSVSADLRALKVKLFDLEVVRRERALQFTHADLVVGFQPPGENFPSRQRQTAQDSLEHLRYEARVRNVGLALCAVSQEAARHVVERSAA